jgi:hypothetical protein
MTLPVFDNQMHDIGIDDVGFMRAEIGDGRITLQDLGPATSQSNDAPGEFVTFETESAEGQSDWGGGIGQYKHAASDTVLDQVGNGSLQGLLYPAYLPQDAGGAGSIATGKMFSLAGTAWGFDSTTLRQLGTATTVAAGQIPTHQPVVTGGGHAMWADTAGAVRSFDGTTVSIVTPTGFTAWNLARFGKWVFAFGKRSMTTTQGPRAGYSASYASVGVMKSHELVWPTRTLPGDLLVMFWAINGGVIEVGIDSTDAIVTKNIPPKAAVRAGWKPLPIVSNTAGAFATVFGYYMDNAPERAGTEWAEFDAECSAIGFLNAYTGLRLEDVIDQVVKNIVTASNNLATGTTATTDFANETLLSIHATDGSGTIAPAAGWTERGDAGATGSTIPGASTSLRGAYYEKTVSATGTQSHTPTTSGTPNSANMLVTLRGNNLAAALDRFQIMYTTDDGATWHSVPFEVAAGIEQVRCSYAALGSVWFATDSYLYEMTVTEDFDTTTGRYLPQIAIAPVDGPWPTPISGGLNGRWIAVQEGAVHVTVDSRIRRYPRGADATDIWPAGTWVARAGKVQSLVDIGGILAFGANGRLYLFNGRGFQSIAEEPGGESGGFDELFFHSGRLYYKSAVAQKYIYMGYASQRPDLQTGFAMTTGESVSSYFTFGKSSVPKVLRTFETNVYWRTQGTLNLYYLADVDPSSAQTVADIQALPWVLIGSHTDADGPIKQHELATSALATGRRFWFRLSNVPKSATSYGIVTAWTAFGRAVMPRYNRIIATLEISDRDVG